MREAGGWAAILFDLDGTLADTIDLILRCYRHTMETHLGASRPDREWLASIGTPLREQLRAFARTDDEIEAMAQTYMERQRELHDGLVRPYPGVCETLAVLAERRIPLGVVTSKRRLMAVRALEQCGIGHHFDVLIDPHDVPRGKPHADPVLAALRALGGPPKERVLFVGDAPADILAGRAAGVRTAAALWGPIERETLVAAGPDYLLESVEELLVIMPA